MNLTTGLYAKSWTLYSFSSTVFVLDFIAIWTDVHSDWDVRQNGRGYFTRYKCGWILLLSQTQFCKKYYFKIGSFRLRFLSPSLRESKTVLVASGFQVLPCEQAVRGALAAGWEKEGELANTSLEVEFHLQCPRGYPSTELSNFRQSARSGNEC